MSVLRAYMMRSSGSLPGRGPAKGDPFLGALIGAGLPFLKKLGGKAISKLTGGKLIGKGGGTAAVIRAAKGVAGFGGAVGAGVVGSKIAGRIGVSAGGRRTYRRMNAGNAKALRRAFRRIDSFTKLAAKAGYVRKKPFGGARKRKVC